MPETSRSRLALKIIIFVAILLRLLVATYIGNTVMDLPGTYDQISYDTLAQRVLAGHGFSFGEEWWPATPAGEPTAHWSFLYTLYLVAVYGLVGYSPLIARLLQAVLAGWLMPWLVYRLGKRHFGTHVGLVAAGLSAVYIYFIYYAANLMTESFYIIGILWTLDLAGELGKQQQNTSHAGRLTLLLGVALAITVLLRQVFLLFIPILFVWLLWQRYRSGLANMDISAVKRNWFEALWTKPMWQMMRILSGAALVLILAILPWTWRNYQAFGRFVLLNTNAGFAFFWGNHPIYGYNFTSILPNDGPSYYSLIPTELLSLNEADLEQALLRRGIGFVQDDPVRYVILSLSRIKDYFKFWPSADSGLISNLSRLLSFGIMWPFMAYGFFFHLRRSWHNESLIIYLFIIFYTAIHLLTWALIRYRLPVDALLLPFAAYSLVALFNKIGAENWVSAPLLKGTEQSTNYLS